MAKFHRFVDPSYYLFPGESFPATPGGTGTIGNLTYDRVNVESGGTGAGDSSNADGQRATAPNEFTYFVGFGEPATSLNVNRGLRAAFESLDAVDDTLRTSIAVRGTQTGVSAGPSIAVAGWVYVGTSPLEAASDLVSLTTPAGTRPLNGTTPVAVQDIQDGGGATVIGQMWYEDPTIILNTGYSGDYVLQYGARGSFARTAEQAPGALWSVIVEGSAAIANLNLLFGFGLDEKYRLATAPTSPGTLDTPGAGAVFTRDGQAITGVMPETDIVANFAAQDPFGSVYLSRYSAYSTTQVVSSEEYGGDIPFLVQDGRRHDNFSAGTFASAPGTVAAVSANVVPMDVASPVSDGGAPVFTYVPAGASAVIAGAFNNEVQLTAPAYFGFTGGGPTINSAICMDRDLLKVTNPVTGGSRVFVITQILSETSVLIRPTANALSTATGLTAGDAVEVQWFTTRAVFGGYSKTGTGLPALGLYGDYPVTGAGFGTAAGPQVEYVVPDGATTPAKVGFYKQVAVPNATGPAIAFGRREVLALDSEGNVNTYYGPTNSNQGALIGALRHRSGPFTYTDQSQSLIVDPVNPSGAEGTTGRGLSHLVGGSVGAPGISPTITFDTSGLALDEGLEIRWTWEFTAGCEATFVWGGTGATPFRFSSPEDAQPGPTQVTGGTIVWTGVVANGVLYMSRLDYPN